MATDHELRGNWELKTDVVYAKYENYDVSSKGIKKKLSSLLFDKWKMWCLKYIWWVFFAYLVYYNRHTYTTSI